MAKHIPGAEQRTYEELNAHYLVERELADKLRRAGKEERMHLYTSLYNELYQRVPRHPQLTRKADPELQQAALLDQMKFLKKFLSPQCTFMEIGPGDCSLSIALSKFVEKVYAIDVSDEIAKSATFPVNFELIISDGCRIPVPKNSIGVAYSYQLMEHLHPEDASEQVRNVYETLAPGGAYICSTPSRLTGPHDVSKYFDDIATGFHLKEYSVTELAKIFRKAGFSTVRVFFSAKGIHLSFPVLPVFLLEWVLLRLPKALSKQISGLFPVRVLLGITMIGRKSFSGP